MSRDLEEESHTNHTKHAKATRLSAARTAVAQCLCPRWAFCVKGHWKKVGSVDASLCYLGFILGCGCVPGIL